jgi:hypothetical protein
MVPSLSVVGDFNRQKMTTAQRGSYLANPVFNKKDKQMPSTHQSVTISTPIENVWKKLSDFHHMAWASKVLSSVEKVGDTGGDEIGAKRVLNGAFHETLTKFDPANYRLEYSIDDGPSPVSKDEVSNYIGVIQLNTSQEGDTTVVWSSSWESNSEDAVEFCHGIYVALLGELAGSF